MSGRDRDFLDDMMDSLDEFWLYEQMTKDDDKDDDVNLDFDDGFDLDDDTDTYDDTDPDDEPDEDFILTASESARTAPYQNEDPEIYNDFFDGKEAGYNQGYELGFFAGYDTGKCNFPDKIPESPKPKDYAFSNGFQVGFTEGYEMGYEEGCKRSGHISELEKYRHPPYTKEKNETAVNTKYAEPVNVQKKINTLVSTSDTEYAVTNSSSRPTSKNTYIRYNDTRKIDAFRITIKIIVFAALAFLLISIIIDIESTHKANKEIRESIAAEREKNPSYNYRQGTTATYTWSKDKTATKRTTTRKTTTTKRTTRKKTTIKTQELAYKIKATPRSTAERYES